MTAAKQNEATVLAFVRGYRAQRIEEDKERGWGYAPSDTHALATTPKSIAHATGLTYGKVSGALKRLEKQGLIVEVSESRGYRGSGWASTEEVERAQQAQDKEDTEELLGHHGSTEAYRERVLTEIGRLRNDLDALRYHAVIAENVLDIRKVSRALPDRGYRMRSLLGQD